MPAQLHQAHRGQRHRRAGQRRPLRRLDRFQPGPRSPSHHHLRPHPLNKNREPDISYIRPDGRSHRHRTCSAARWWCSNPPPIPAPPTKTCARCSRRLPAQGGPGFSPGLLAGARRSRQPGQQVARIHKVVGGYTPPASSRLAPSTARPSRPSSPSPPAAAEATKLLENIFRGVTSRW